MIVFLPSLHDPRLARMFSSAIAASFQQHPAGALIIDALPEAGGLAVDWDLDRTPGSRWNDLHSTTGKLDAEAFLDALPGQNHVRVLSHHPQPAKLSMAAWHSVLHSLAGKIPVIITGSAIPSASQLQAAPLPTSSHWVFPCQASVLGAIALEKALGSFRDYGGSWHAITLGGKAAAQMLAAEAHLPVLASLPRPRIALRHWEQDVEAGVTPPGWRYKPLQAVGQAVLSGLQRSLEEPRTLLPAELAGSQA